MKTLIKDTLRKCLYCEEWYFLRTRIDLTRSKFCSQSCTARWRKINDPSFTTKNRKHTEDERRLMHRQSPRLTGMDNTNWRHGRSPEMYRAVWTVDGPKYEHRLVAEKALGSPLTRDEVVHHIDGDKQNNANTNLLICGKGYHKWLHGYMSFLYQQLMWGNPQVA